jgi:FdhD protein
MKSSAARAAASRWSNLRSKCVIAPSDRVKRDIWRRKGLASGERTIPEETAVSFTYDGGSYAVMMATPQDLEDFAYGFSLTEGIVGSIEDIEHLEVIEEDLGIDLRIWLGGPRSATYGERRRHLAGPAGCGLCGIESLAAAMRTPRKVPGEVSFQPEEIMKALDALAPAQVLNHETRAVHAAAFWLPGEGLVAVREDVGRHNALDKLAGALARRGLNGGKGFLVFTSRVSVEMIQKAAAVGVPLAVAVSAPTALAVRVANAANMTLVAVARQDGFEIFTRRDRITAETAACVA